MAVQAYASWTSVAQGDSLDFHLNDTGTGVTATVVVTDLGTGQQRLTTTVVVGHHDSPADPGQDRGWPVGFTLDIPADWPSALYRADFEPAGTGENVVFFVVRAANPGEASGILVAVPFPTWLAYSYSGVPGASPYWNEQPDRAHRVSLNRPMGGPAWESPIVTWLTGSGIPVEYCSLFDLHDGRDLLRAYRLVVSVGHDEYWSAGMRDNVEAFLAGGGNAAFFSGNTCWWQFRLEDDGKTFVVYRDPFVDPLSGVDNQHVAVEWSSYPVNRPENSMTGVSFRYGAGCWDNLDVIGHKSWTVRFADHWVFEGTGLADGATFGTGTVGYETDAADIVDDDDGVPRVTGRDGTPRTFVVLATADLTDWRAYGQGGAATLGTFRAPGGGTVFTAGTTGWGSGLAQPQVDRITRNVLNRLSDVWPGRTWERIGGANQVRSMAATENHLFAVDASTLWVRDPVGQNVKWHAVSAANDIHAMTNARDASPVPVSLYAITGDQQLIRRQPVFDDSDWTPVVAAPDVVAFASSNEILFAVTANGNLVYRELGVIDLVGGEWKDLGPAPEALTMTNLNGRIYLVTPDGEVFTRLPFTVPTDWVSAGSLGVAAPTAITGWAGKLYVATADGQLLWRDAIPFEAA